MRFLIAVLQLLEEKIMIVRCIVTTGNSTLKDSYEEEWVVRVLGGTQVSSLLALQSGCKNLGLVMGFKDTYLWRVDKRQIWKRNNDRFIKALTLNPKIVWVDHQRTFQRHKRDFIDDIKSEKILIRDKRIFNADNYVNEIEKKLFNDELWNQEWYMQDRRNNKQLPKLDLNVIPLYQQGITGRGIRVAVLDDGFEYTHEDLKNNYVNPTVANEVFDDPIISYDINEGDNDPIPRYEITGMNGHGTRCAGEIAMEANNGKCGVGIAYDSSIGGIKLLDGLVNDRIEGEALSYRQDLIDIYTASWGPADDGKSLEAPGRLANEALERGINEGRGGKGNIYVWASGNGGSKDDNCGCDGYVGSIYTIAVGSASQMGKFPWYGEKCPATLATTYSSGSYNDQMIATTDLNNKCTTRHTGTSASAPLAAGILALALQVKKNPGWQKNSAGFWFNSRFGFGLMNAHSLVTAAYNWSRVPNKIECTVKAVHRPRTLLYGKPVSLIFNVDHCPNENTSVKFLEHVEIETNIKYTKRGALQMYLTSPHGTKVKILSSRKFDVSVEGFKNWKFMSVGTWGEDPRGTWTLDIIDVLGPKTNNGTIDDITLIIHGTKYPPNYRLDSKIIHDDDHNRIKKIVMNNVNVIEVDGNVKENMWNLKNNEINFTKQFPRLERLIQFDWLRRLLFG
ncbi:hypothetical protein PV328_005088 [Microctonus aethiopoides]|uniref:P/Homo B domain-containing protein n=1 Tax=Microctonus aethiopoides TaxID=144406 RepID=A0AA39FLL2_9HYME|nr:hypothetical protein PV328_005088 [Microctonus aethiopoides]